MASGFTRGDRVIVTLGSLGPTSGPGINLSALVTLEVSNSDVALVTERFQIIVVVPASKLVTTTIPGDDMIDFNAAPRWADSATLTRPLITPPD